MTVLQCAVFCDAKLTGHEAPPASAGGGEKEKRTRKEKNGTGRREKTTRAAEKTR